MKKFYLIFLFASLCFISQAQVSVTATAGTPGPTSYTTLEAAVSSINTGIHQGVINITLNASTTETIPSVFVQSGTLSASYTVINIVPAAGVAAVVTGDIAGPLLDFSGSDNININGLNAGGSSLEFSNMNTTAAANTVRFTDGATSVFIERCSLLGANPTNNSGTVFFGTGGNTIIHLAGNRIGDASTGTPANAIYSAGTAGLENRLNVVSGNLIYNYFQPGVATTGISLTANNSNWTIENNEFYQTSPRVFTAGFIHRAIQINGGEQYTISGNIIGGSAPNAAGLYELSGSSTRFTAIEVLNAGVTLGNSIQGNRVQNIQVTTTSGAGAPQGVFTGIYVLAGNANIGGVQGNIIGAGTGNGSIRILPSTGGSVVTGITYSGAGIFSIENNTVGAIDLMPALALSGNAFAVQVLGAGATATIRNNTLGGSTANSISIGVKGTTTGNGIIRGIFTNNNGTMNVSDNLVQNLTHNSSNVLALFRAIECQAGTVSIVRNTINNIAAEGVSVNTATHEGIGIIVTSALPNILIDSNTISNLMLTNTGAIGTILSGIYIGSLNTGARITRNRIFGFSNAATGTSITAPPVAAGIYLRDVASGELFVANNMLSLGSSQTTNTAFIGIWNQVNPAVGYNERLYYNSINIAGTATSGAQPSFAYYRGNFTTTFTGPTIDMKNNILINNRSGGTGAHFAIANSYGAASSASGWPANASNYNVLNASVGTVGYWSASLSFTEWQGTSLSDNNSLNAVAVAFVDPVSNLHLVADANAAVEGKATPLAAVTTDFDNNPRDVATPDLGADELLAVVPVRIEFFRGQKQTGKNLLEWKVNSTSLSVQFVIERSSNGQNFVVAGDVRATSFNQLFSFVDLAPAAGLNYYRLKMVEPDGNISYSAVISLASAIKNMDVSIRPNYISNGIANLNIQSQKTTQVTATMTDVSGKVILKKIFNVTAGTVSYPINVSSLAKGVYYISINDQGSINTQQLVVE